MPLEQLTPYLPAAAIAAGLLVLAWSQRDRIGSLLSRLRTEAQTDPPAKRFARLYALRQWCEAAGHAEAVEAIDAYVLPAIVREAEKGGPTS